MVGCRDLCPGGAGRGSGMTAIAMQREPAARRGARITAVDLTVRHSNGAIGLDDVNLTIEPGQLTAVIGPSGAGKSTLLDALAGITPVPTEAVTFYGVGGSGEDAAVG